MTVCVAWGAVLAAYPALPAVRAAEGLVINEVIASNRNTPPRDIGGGTPDMVEIYNALDEEIVLGGCCPSDTYCLSDTPEWPEGSGRSAWCFPPGTRIPPGGFLIVFCDGNIDEGFCEFHATFQIAADGSEPISLWAPEAEDGTRRLVDQIWLPPLEDDVSIGRVPDGAGPAPVPVADTLDVLEFHPPGTATFGECVEDPSRNCFLDVLRPRRSCTGAPNVPGGNLPPRIERVGYSTNQPEPDEPVLLSVAVRDDKLRSGMSADAIRAAIVDVQAVYRVVRDGVPGPWETVSLELDTAAGVQDDAARGRPLDLWTLWAGSIPGQPEGARVQFYFRARDAEQAAEGPDVWSTSPRILCAEGVGPCDREFGGPGCELDPDDVVCEPPLTGQRYKTCNEPFTYLVGYTPRGSLANVVINEIVPSQNGLLEDRTQGTCREGTARCVPGAPDNPNCCREDFIELYNSGGEDVDLSGLWLADSPFHPRGWRFPEGSILRAGGRILVWLDNDGERCPDPDRPDPPCFWECPDPTDPLADPPEFHTNFALDAAGDQIFLYDTEENGFGVIHGLDFSDPSVFGSSVSRFEENHSLSLIPDGDRNGCWVLTPEPTPRNPNRGECPGAGGIFKRGDSNNDCNVDLADGVFTLNYLFIGGPAPVCPDAADADDDGTIALTDAVFTFNHLFRGGLAPPPPGTQKAGPDPTEDGLPECLAEGCP